MTLVLSKKQWGSTEMHTTIAASVKIEKPWDLGLRGTGGQQLNCNQNLSKWQKELVYVVTANIYKKRSEERGKKTGLKLAAALL